MPHKRYQCLLIDPTKEESELTLMVLYHKHMAAQQPREILYEFESLSYTDSHERSIEICLTHDIFRFTHVNEPGVTSLKTTHFQSLNFGSYGCVSPIPVEWKADNHGKFSYQSYPEDERYMVKWTNLSTLSAADKERIYKHYLFEQVIGEHTPHMGTVEPVKLADNRLLLLMKQQNGCTLKKLIELCEINPNYLTVTQYLEISVKLLEVLKAHAHDIKVNGSPVVHGDIKPSNIMVTLWPKIKVTLVDYGLSITHDTIPDAYCVGTAKYQDPLVLNGTLPKVDAQSDLASMYFTLAEFWRDNSRQQIIGQNNAMCRALLIEQNRDYPLTGLCEGIADLKPKEQACVTKVTQKGTRESRKLRPSYSSALKQFRQLLKARQQQDRKYLHSIEKACKTDKAFQKLSDDDLLLLLQSEHAYCILGTNNQFLDRLPIISSRLNIRLLNIPIETLYWLYECGLRIEPGLDLVADCIEQVLGAQFIKKLLALGAVVNKTHLINLLETQNMSINQNYIELVHVLCDNLSADDIQYVKAHVQISDEKLLVFKHYFLTSPQLYDVETEIRLIERHISLKPAWEKKLAHICTIIKKYNNDQALPLCKTILNYKDTPPLLFSPKQIEYLNDWHEALVLFLNLRQKLIKAAQINIDLSLYPELHEIRHRVLTQALDTFDKIAMMDASDWQDQLLNFMDDVTQYERLLKTETVLQELHVAHYVEMFTTAYQDIRVEHALMNRHYGRIQQARYEQTFFTLQGRPPPPPPSQNESMRVAVACW